MELIGLTLAGGATVTNATGEGSLLLVSSGASLVGQMLQMSQSKNTPSLVCQGSGTSVHMYDTLSSVHSDGAVLVRDQATLLMYSATFTSNVASYGGCIRVDGAGSSATLAGLSASCLPPSELPLPC